jgi:hypothetical protein
MKNYFTIILLSILSTNCNKVVCQNIGIIDTFLLDSIVHKKLLIDELTMLTVSQKDFENSNLSVSEIIKRYDIELRTKDIHIVKYQLVDSNLNESNKIYLIKYELNYKETYIYEDSTMYISRKPKEFLDSKFYKQMLTRCTGLIIINKTFEKISVVTKNGISDYDDLLTIKDKKLRKSIKFYRSQLCCPWK